MRRQQWAATGFVVAWSVVGCRTRPLPEIDTATPDDFALGRADLAEPPTDHALLCDGLDDEVAFDVTGWLEGPSGFTLELWFRSDDPMQTPTQIEYVLSTPTNDAFGDNVEVHVTMGFGHHAVWAQFGVEAGGSCGGTSDGLGSGELSERWHHLAAEYSSVTGDHLDFYMFLDGVLTVSDQQPVTPICFAPHRVVLCHGPMAMFATPFRGAIDDLRLSSIARYSGNFTPSKSAVDAFTVALLRFDSLPLVEDGPHALPITMKGDPRLTDQVHP